MYTIAVDFDGTLVTDAFPDITKAKPNYVILLQLLDRVNQIRENGYKDVKLILWTCREDLPEGNYLTDAIDYCKEVLCLEFDAINENPPEVSFKSRKVVADMYIDDRAYMPTTDFYKFVKNIVSMDNYQLIESPIFTTKKEE